MEYTQGMKNKIKKFEKLCKELNELIVELGQEDLEVIYHLNSDKFELTDGSNTLVEVDAPLLTMWDQNYENSRL